MTTENQAPEGADALPAETLDCWRINYALDKTPHELVAFWVSNTPPGAVLALKTACAEIARLRAALAAQPQDEPTWAGAVAFIQHVQNVAGASGSWSDEFLASYQPDQWFGEHRAAAVFLGEKLAALAAQPVMLNGLTEAETNETASVKGLTQSPAEAHGDERDAQEQPFEDWWKREGQFCRAGGGEYEKTFAWNAWCAASQAQPNVLASLALISSGPESL